MKLVVPVLALCVGCDDIFDIERLPAIDAAGSVCIEDDFSAGLDLMKWAPFGAATSASVATASGQLVITLPESDGTAQPYGGITTTNRDLTGASFEVEIVEPAAGPASESTLQITHDNDNRYSLSVSQGTLYTRVASAAAGSIGTMFTYDATDHRFVRLHHDALARQMIFEVRSANGEWQTLERFDALAPLENSYLEVYAGTFAASPASRAVFDNVLATGPCAQ